MMNAFIWFPVMFSGFILLMWVPLAILAFNVDTKNVNVISGPKGSLFGYSASFLPVAQDNNILNYLHPIYQIHRMLVGAPNTRNRDGVTSGVLYLCENVLDSTKSCKEELYFDDALTMTDGTLNEEFGSALTMTNSGNYMVCSPNWKDTEANHYIFVIVRCTFYDGNSTVFRPFYDAQGKKLYQQLVDGKMQFFHGLANFGFSVDSNRISIFVFGSPGVLMSEGTVTITDIKNTNSMKTATSAKVDKLNSTAYGYLGYSVKIGRFCDGSDVCFAASAPNRNRVGEVLIYRWQSENDLILLQTIEGQQPWSYFGYILCAVDANSDDYDELLVGAPHYTDLGDIPQGYDQGRVFIYSRSKTSAILEQKDALEGTRQKFARFGTAIQNIGDINLDEYNDVAVGAPGESDGTGCIYIYFGGASGLVNSPGQQITAKQVTDGLPKPVKGLGFAFSDYTTSAKQKYPNFAATSVVSDAIVVFKFRPIVDVLTNLTADPNPVNMEEPCIEQDVTGVCFKISMCMKYTLRGGENLPLTFKIGLDMDVKVRSKSKRALIRLTYNNLVESTPEINMPMIVSNDYNCTDFVTVLRENQVNQDRFTPVEIIAKYNLVEDASTSSKVNPVLDAMKPNNVSLKVTFENKCGDDKICEVDLSVHGYLNYRHGKDWSSIVVNSTMELLVHVSVTNSKDPSYGTVIKVEINSLAPFSRFTSDVAANCQPEQSVLNGANAVTNTVPARQDKTTVLCNYYKPFYQNANISILVVFDTEQIELTKKALTITVEAMPNNKNNPEVSPKDNTVELTTFVEIIADVFIDGFSSPTEFTIYEAKQISLKDTGGNQNNFRTTGNEVKPLNVTHKILVKNNGPSFLPRTTVSVSVPLFLVDRTELINVADVKIAAADGRVTQCYGTKTFDYLQQTTSSTHIGRTSQSQSTDSEGFTHSTTSEDYFKGASVNRRKRDTINKKEDQNTFYKLDCDSDKSICQVFVCDIVTIMPSGSHAEINVTLVIDKANIPIPENYKAFYYIIQAQVKVPFHDLVKKWETEPVVKTITKFHLVQFSEKINIWIIIGSIIAGLVLIIIIVLVFWKLGFFKRDKRQQVEEWRHQKSRKGSSKAPNDDVGEGESALAN